jgi:hypothetical protein
MPPKIVTVAIEPRDFAIWVATSPWPQEEQLGQMNKFASANPDSGVPTKFWPSSLFQEVRAR